MEGILKKIVILQTIVLVCFVIFKDSKKELPIVQDQFDQRYFDQPIPEQEPEEQKPLTPEPEFINWPPVRTVNNPRYGKILSDIESHLPAGHIYGDSDLITDGHECLHGIHANIRNANYGGLINTYVIRRGLFRRPLVFHEIWSGGRVNGFYCLENRAVVIQEPSTTISAAARLVPSSLRGDVFNLYMIQQARSWGDTPLYICDEWNAYVGGSAVRADLQIQERSETVQYSMEFTVYTIALAKAIKENDSSYDDTQFKNFVMWNTDRLMKIYNNESGATNYLKKFRTSSDAESLRQFAKEYFGAEWCKEILGI